MTKHSLCWDCRRSADKTCCWASHSEPVKGWVAESRVIKGTKSTPNMVSYRVDNCPEFCRDSWGGGLHRMGSDGVKKYIVREFELMARYYIPSCTSDKRALDIMKEFFEILKDQEKEIKQLKLASKVKNGEVSEGEMDNGLTLQEL